MPQTRPRTSVPIIRLMLIREKPGCYQTAISSSRDIAQHAKDMKRGDREEFRIYLLNAKHRLIGVHTVALGSLTVAIVHPREVYKAAVLANACAIIGVNNHPSGDPEPSPEDHALTTRLVEAGVVLGIPFLDHIIIGHHRHFSFADQGQLRRSSQSTPLTEQV